MHRQQLMAAAMAAMLAVAACAPMPQTRNTALETGRSDVLTVADEKPGSNNKSNNSSCCSSDPKGSSNSSSNRSVNLDDFKEKSKAGPGVEELINAQRAQQASQTAAVAQQQRNAVPVQASPTGTLSRGTRRRTFNSRRRSSRRG